MANVVPETLPSYTFTGQHLLLDDGDGHWRIKFLSSGVLEWLSPDTVIDLFLVGAGGAGGHIRGGGGGYTQTYKQITIKRGQRIQITVGAGGNGMFVGGGSTTFDSYSVSGGGAGGKNSSTYPANGGSGGGGSNYYGSRNAGNGGSDGGNGYESGGIVSGGSGQGRTTREFEDSGADLYSGGGGGCNLEGYSGGSGGSGSPKLSGDGRWVSSNSSSDFSRGKGGGGYGGGGGAGWASANGDWGGGAGAQGIAIIRDARA